MFPTPSSKFFLPALVISAAFVAVGLFMLNNKADFPSENSDLFAQVTATYAQLQNQVAQEKLEVATFAGGCFWCMEGPFEAEAGVEAAIVGYTGGEVERPTYRQVVGGGTGHRESVQVFYDPTVVSYAKLLEIYFRQIDPTDPGGQFADRGDMYTTAIYYHSESQRDEALKQIQALSKKDYNQGPIVTEVLPSMPFYPAEDYHQDFYIKSSEYYKRYAKGSGRTGYIEQMEALFVR
jgi:methionine-S-sulfoxide reductase